MLVRQLAKNIFHLQNVQRSLDPDPGAASPEGTHPAGAERVALPAARRLASALGVDLTTLVGTGQDGVITVRDVERFDQARSDMP